MDVAATDDLEGDFDDRSNPDRRVLTLEVDVEQRLGTDRLPLELRRAEALAVPTADLAEDPHRRVRVLVVERQRAEELPQADHDLVDDRREERVEELLREVVDAELESP